MSDHTPLGGPPPADVPVPQELRAALDELGRADARLIPVWANGAGGLTFAVAPPAEAKPAELFAKWNPSGSGESLAAEAERLRWMHGRHPVPVVVALHSTPTAEIMLTEALPGTSAVSARWQEQPEVALRALGTGLRRLHSVEIDDCPFAWSVPHRQEIATPAAALLGPPPRIDRLVLCQGDPCAPNTLLSDDGTFLAHVDLARLGVADRWADLAVMSMSLDWNFPGTDHAPFWDAYGIAPDAERVTYYRALWNAE